MNKNSTDKTEVSSETVQDFIKATKSSDGSIREGIRVDNVPNDSNQEKPKTEKKHTENENTGSDSLNKNEDWFFNALTFRNLLSMVTLSNVLKIIAFVAILSGVYGLTYQKGMVEGAGLTNFGVNYQIQEIYHFAFSGALFFFSDIYEGITPVLELKIIDTPYVSAFFVFIVFAIFSAYLVLSTSPKQKKSLKYKSKNKKNYLILLLLNVVAPISVFFSQISFKYIVSSLGIFLLLPGLLGYNDGLKYIAHLKSNDLCEENIKDYTYDRGSKICPMLTIKGQAIWGDVILETSNAFFIRKKDYFLYVTKTGDNCAFSYYENNSEGTEKNEGKFTLPVDKEIEALCFKKT